MTIFNRQGDAIRAWCQPDRLHAPVWMTDAQALDRIERGYAWVPVGRTEKLVQTIAAELPCDGSGCTYDASGRPSGLCSVCEGLGCCG